MSKWKEMKETTQPEPEEPMGMEAVEKAFDDQLDEALVAFKERREKEKTRFADVTDTNYYFVVCFSNNAQMAEFCEKFGLDISYKYYDGREVARKFKRALQTPDMATPREKGKSKEYTERAMDP